ncbi:MAG: ABC transporter permease [Nitrospinota bacterium]|nr:ABC transporter permease [Nitrospinota bacterium]MDH5677192.1 ABC transporter permease [Nitrospinota bacterium]MDH5756958.1 ABC transporter permease [Nitrospinota bacterium]
MRELADNFSIVYKHRELISNLVAKDLKARYRGSIMGMAWTFLNPLLTLSVYALVFSRYQRIEVQNYAVFMFAGLLPWIWFSSSLLEGVNSITGAGALITKSMFPAEILPMVKIISNLFNYIFSLPLLFGFIIWFDVDITLSILWLPFLMLGQLLFTTGLVYFVASINVRFRDVQHVLANLMLLWFFLCPIIYPKSAIPAELKLYTYTINPMAHLAVGYQDIFINGRTPDLFAISMVMLAGTVCMILGIRQFEHGRETFAEEI